MANSLPILVSNLAEEIHKVKCRNEHDNKNVKHLESNTKIVIAQAQTQTLKMI